MAATGSGTMAARPDATALAWRLGLAGILFLLAMTSGHAADSERWAASLSQSLSEYGLTLSEMRDVIWRTDHFQDDPMLPEEARPISGYRFYGRPERCPGGTIAIDMWSDCSITDIRSRGNCRIDGIRHGWL